MDDRRPRVLRHHRAGVWIGYLLGPGDVPNSIRFEGRKVRIWRGGRNEVSQLATDGVTERDTLGDWVRTTIPINEELNYIHETTVEHVEHARGLPRKFTDDD